MSSTYLICVIGRTSAHTHCCNQEWTQFSEGSFVSLGESSCCLSPIPRQQLICFLSLLIGFCSPQFHVSRLIQYLLSWEGDLASFSMDNFLMHLDRHVNLHALIFFFPKTSFEIVYSFINVKIFSQVLSVPLADSSEFCLQKEQVYVGPRKGSWLADTKCVAHGRTRALWIFPCVSASSFPLSGVFQTVEVLKSS